MKILLVAALLTLMWLPCVSQVPACSRMSVLKLGVIDQPSAPMLLFDGAQDTPAPIRDLTILLLHGSIKQAWVHPQGRPVGQAKDWPNSRMTGEIVQPWIHPPLASSQPPTGAA